MRVTLKIDPAKLPSAQEKGISRNGVVYTKARVREAKQMLVRTIRDTVAVARDQLELERGTRAVRRYHDAHEGRAWKVAITFVYRLKHTPKRSAGEPKATRPDLDNLTKLVLDSLTESMMAFADDGQVAVLQVRKRHAWADEPAHVQLEFVPAGEENLWTMCP